MTTPRKRPSKFEQFPLATGALVFKGTAKQRRPVGDAPWKMSAATIPMWNEIVRILNKYNPYWPLTSRQVGYIGMPSGLWTKKEFETVGGILARGRRAGPVPWDAIDDQGILSHVPRVYEDLAHFYATGHLLAQNFVLNPMQGQDVVPEILVEARGAVPQFVTLADTYGVPLFSNGGMTSVTGWNKLASRAVARWQKHGQRTRFLVFGDLDRSGLTIIQRNREDLEAFITGRAGAGVASFEWVAVRPEQEKSHKLQVHIDIAGKDGALLPNGVWVPAGTQIPKIELDAFDPARLVRLTESRIKAAIDLALYQQKLDEGDAIREMLEKQYSPHWQRMLTKVIQQQEAKS